jgi:hypothetical protein
MLTYAARLSRVTNVTLVLTQHGAQAVVHLACQCHDMDSCFEQPGQQVACEQQQH